MLTGGSAYTLHACYPRPLLTSCWSCRWIVRSAITPSALTQLPFPMSGGCHCRILGAQESQEIGSPKSTSSVVKALRPDFVDLARGAITGHETARNSTTGQNLTPLDATEMEEEADPFGFAGCSIDEGPDAHRQPADSLVAVGSLHHIRPPQASESWPIPACILYDCCC